MYSHGARNGDSMGEKISPDELIFETKSWCPPELGIQEIASELAKKVSGKNGKGGEEEIIREI